MLESGRARLAQASTEERGRAERFAAVWMRTMLEQDLIPADEAETIVAEHREGGTEEWLRAVYAALVGLRAVA